MRAHRTGDGPNVLAEREARLSLRQRTTVLMLIAGAAWVLVLAGMLTLGWDKAKNTTPPGIPMAMNYSGVTRARGPMTAYVTPIDNPDAGVPSFQYRGWRGGGITVRREEAPGGRIVLAVPTQAAFAGDAGFLWVGKPAERYPYIELEAASFLLGQREHYRLVGAWLGDAEKRELHDLLDARTAEFAARLGPIDPQHAPDTGTMGVFLAIPRDDLTLVLQWRTPNEPGQVRRVYDLSLRERRHEGFIFHDLVAFGQNAVEIPYFMDGVDEQKARFGYLNHRLGMRGPADFASRILVMRMFHPALLVLLVAFLVLLPLMWSSHVRRRMQYYQPETLESTFDDATIAQAFATAIRKRWLFAAMVLWLPPVAAIAIAWIAYGPGMLHWYDHRHLTLPGIVYHLDTAAILALLTAVPLMGLYSTYRALRGGRLMLVGLFTRALLTVVAWWLSTRLAILLLTILGGTALGNPEWLAKPYPVAFLAASVLLSVPVGWWAWRRLPRAVDAMWQGMKPSNRR